MTVCTSCSTWLTQSLATGLADILHGCHVGMHFEEATDAGGARQLTIYEAPFRHSYRWILQHKRWCWICCHLWFFSDAKFDKFAHKVEAAGDREDGRRIRHWDSDDVLAGVVYVETDAPSVFKAKQDVTGRTSNARVSIRWDFGPELHFDVCDALDLKREEVESLDSLVYSCIERAVSLDQDGSCYSVTTPASLPPKASRYSVASEPDRYSPIDDVKVQATLVRSWLDECNSSHTGCRRTEHGPASDSGGVDNGKGPRLPTRLVHVGLDDSEVRLVETAGLNASTVRYATLSHMWGKQAFEKLTLGNYHASLAHLSPLSLPRTFREVILFCRWLGIEYVWIDSLCIIQDSASDWDAESVLMHYVYGGSLINLAATASSSPAQGLFRPYQPLLGQELVLHVPGVAKLKSTFEWYTNSRWFEKHDNDAPLLKRGWVLQECLLATRILHFTDRGLLFTCNEAQKTETRISFRGKRGRFNFEDASTARQPDEIDRAWEGIMRAYSDARLTVPSDRVIALAGAAAFVHDSYAKLGTQTWYTAGCWDHNIVAQLHWYYLQGVSPQTDGPGLAIPSWSWLASKGRLIEMPRTKDIIQWCDKGVGRRMRLVRAHRRNVDLNAPFGTIGITSVLVEAFLFDLLGRMFMDVRDEPDAAAELLQSNDHDDGDFDRKGFTSVPIPDNSLPRSVGLYLDSQPVGVGTLRCALLSGVFSDVQFNLSYLSYALILQDVDEQKDGLRRYRRLGLMVLDRRRMKESTRHFFSRDDLPLRQFWLV